MARKAADAAIAPAVDPMVGKLVWFFEHTENGGRYEHVAKVEQMLPDGCAELSFQRTGELARERATAPRITPGHVGSGWAER